MLILSSVFLASYPKPAFAAPCNCVVFRLDDVQDYWIDSVQAAVMDKFIGKNAKLTLGEIMNFFGNDPIVVDKTRQGGGLFEYALHGWNHDDYTTFSQSKQQSELQKANDKMQSLYGKKSNIFITPYNVFNADTLVAMQNLGIKIISADTFASYYEDNLSTPLAPVADSRGIYHAPETAAFSEWTNNQHFQLTSSQILSEIDSSIADRGWAVVTLHPQDFSKYDGDTALNSVDSTSMARIDSVLNGVSSRGYAIKSFGELVGTASPPQDTTPPVVTTMPAGGSYSSAQSVVLSANEPATIYYTTNGSTPTTSSAVYSSPISVSATTTLKFFARDTAGNSGLVRTEIYTISPGSFPATRMSDTTQTYGLSLYSATQSHVEFVSPSSQLVGKTINEITLKLRKTGAPTGTVQIGVFNSDLTVKKLFGTKDATTITSTYADYAFSLPSELYTIQAGDRIGIKYTGGNSNNYAAVMLDRDSADPFDGANTYRQQYNTSWISYTSDDMYMILRQTHG
ncbi:MAG: chitobiase/beta-hexosaminidase C-terminal domain-containing protein [Nitrososphaera sp.]